MAILIPQSYIIHFGGLPGTVVEIIADGSGWSAHTEVQMHLIERYRSPGEFIWVDDDWGDPYIFPTAQEAADTAERATWY